MKVSLDGREPGAGQGEKGYAFWRSAENREWLGKRNKSKISRSIFTKQFYS